MTSPRSLMIQSVLYENDPDNIVQAAAALANSASLAREAGIVGEWSYLVGDSSAERVLDNAHLDRIGDEVAAAGGVVRYEFFGANLGHGGGQNRLAELADSDLLLILDSDGQLAPDAVGVLAETVNGSVGVADARQLPLEHPKDYDAGTGETSWCSGACSMTRRSTFEKLGGFDHEAFFKYHDDVDYSWRLRLAGYRVVYAPAAAIFRDQRLSRDGARRSRVSDAYYSAEAALMLAYKYSRPDVVTRLSKVFSGGDDDAQRALAEFHRRRTGGILPTPLDGDHRVAQFVKGNCGVHRF